MAKKQQKKNRKLARDAFEEMIVEDARLQGMETDEEILEYIDMVKRINAGNNGGSMSYNNDDAYGGRAGSVTPTKWNGGNTGSVSAGTVYRPCSHTGTKPIYHDDRGVTFFVANFSGLVEEAYDYVLDLANVTRSYTGTDVANKFVTKAPNEKFFALNQYVAQSNVIRLDWKDQSAPPVKFEFWTELWKLFPAESTVCIACQGGHGRSGTCLAAMMIADGYRAWEAIDHVRKVHCSEAIESSSQIKYLEKMSMALHGEMGEKPAPKSAGAPIIAPSTKASEAKGRIIGLD